MKAITLYEPWASFIARGLKTIETRIHARFGCLVGQRIAIHAGKKFDHRAFYVAGEILERHGESLPTQFPMRHCEIVCTAFVYRGRWLNPDDTLAALIDCGTRERYGIFLREIEPVNEGIILRGKQGMWNWEPKK